MTAGPIEEPADGANTSSGRFAATNAQLSVWGPPRRPFGRRKRRRDAGLLFYVGGAGVRKDMGRSYAVNGVFGGKYLGIAAAQLAGFDQLVPEGWKPT